MTIYQTPRPLNIDFILGAVEYHLRCKVQPVTCTEISSLGNPISLGRSLRFFLLVIAIFLLTSCGNGNRINRYPLLVASDLSTSSSDLITLSNSNDPTVRYAVSHNPSTPPAILNRLSNDEDLNVAFSVIGNPNTPETDVINLQEKIINSSKFGHLRPELLRELQLREFTKKIMKVFVDIDIVFDVYKKAQEYRGEIRIDITRTVEFENISFKIYKKTQKNTKKYKRVGFTKIFNPGFPRWMTNLMTCFADSAIRINAIPSALRANPMSPGG